MTALNGACSGHVRRHRQIHVDRCAIPRFLKCGTSFTASVPVPDFGLKVERDTVTLTGTRFIRAQDAVKRMTFST